MQVQFILKLLRWPNLILVLIFQLFVFLRLNWACIHLTDQCSISVAAIGIIVLTTILITAAGYVINDIQDIEIDQVNKPEHVMIGRHISLLQAHRIYWGLVLLAGAFSVILAVHFSNVLYFAFYLLATVLLNGYSKRWKKSFLTGNLIVGIMCGCSILVILVPDWNDQVMYVGNPTTKEMFLVLSWFAAMLTIYRELVKDVEDIAGDQAGQAHTIPVVLGFSKSKYWILALGFIILGSLLTWAVYISKHVQLWQMILHGLLIMSMVYCQYKVYKATSPKEMHFISQCIKVIMLFGIIVFLLN
jgi:4-hydroxybenzoate polyprenyltransferase